MWKYLAVLILVALQGELVILVSAGAASAGYLNLYGVLAAAALGNMCSDVLWYTLGYYSRIDWLLKRMKWLGISPQQVDQAGRIVRKDALRFLLFAKLTNWLMIPALIATGAAKAPWKKWLWFIVLSDIVIAVIFGLLGYYTTASFIQVKSGLRYVAIGVTFAVVMVSVFYMRKLLARGNLLAAEEETQKIESSGTHQDPL